MRTPTLVLICIFATTAARADTAPVIDTLREDVVPQPSADIAVQVHESRRIDWVALPIPISNPTIGSGLAVTTMALYHLGGAAQPSNTAVGVFKTDNGSSGAGVLQETYLGNTGWQINGALLKANLNLDFFGVGADQGNQNKALPINQDIKGGAIWVMAAVAPGFSLGPRYRFDTVDVRPEVDSQKLADFPVPLPPLNIGLTESTLELLLQYDTRDSRFGPAQGWFTEFSAAFTDKAVGSDITYQKYTLAANWYYRLTPALVLGLRGSLCEASDSTPFFALCLFGMSSDLRGYVTGRYRDKTMFATQAELRWHVWRRLGAVAFAGVGDVAEQFSDLKLSDPLSSVGAGLRFLASPQNRVNIGVDVAYAKNDYTAYFRIGEAF